MNETKKLTRRKPAFDYSPPRSPRLRVTPHAPTYKEILIFFT